VVRSALVYTGTVHCVQGCLSTRCLYRTQRFKSSQPATKSRRNEGMKMWMYVWVFYNEIFIVHWWEATRREKTLGETWAAVIKTINSILRTSVASNCALPGMGTEPESVYGQKRTMKDVLARCLKKTEDHVCTFSIHACCL
jgi:hypothetical protein